MYSYADQTRHYFARPDEGVLEDPPEQPASWRGEELAARDDWRVTLDAGAIAELEAALAVAEATGKPTEALTPADFPLAILGEEIARWRDELAHGRGFQVVSGLPIERFTQEQVERLYWGLGLHLGVPGAQNVAGDLLGHVADTGEDAADPFVRLYRTSADIAYHCDGADVVGLLCLRPARKGGASRIVSSVAVYRELWARRPDLAPLLYEPFALDLRSEGDAAGLQWIPIPPCRAANGQLRTFYHSDYFRSVVRHADVPPFSPEKQELMDLYEAIASEPGMYFDMELAAGDIQWLSNHTVMHARTAYEDDPDPAKRRHLLRLWLSLA
jgi:hypothetical protein